MFTADQLKAVVDPVKVIGETVRLRKAFGGGRWFGLCPFHSEKTPSFSYWESSGRWHCFGCGKAGDIISFLEIQEGLDFRGALRRLAAIAGVLLDSRDTYEEPPLALKLSGPEVRAFDNWLSIEMHRLGALWRWFDQQERACLASLEGRWNEPDQSLDPKAVEDTHRALNFIHEAKQRVEDRMQQLDRDPSAEFEPFLRRLYGSEDFRAAVAA
jgi:hypothetical protein